MIQVRFPEATTCRIGLGASRGNLLFQIRQVFGWEPPPPQGLALRVAADRRHGVGELRGRTGFRWRLEGLLRLPEVGWGSFWIVGLI